MRVCNLDAVFSVRSTLVWEWGGGEGKRSNTWFEFALVGDFSSAPPC